MNICFYCYWDEGAYCCGAIKGLGYLPGETFFLLFALHIAGGKVYPECNLPVVFVSKLFLESVGIIVPNRSIRPIP